MAVDDDELGEGGELQCPTCRRVVRVHSYERIGPLARSTFCPYPSCASVIVTLLTWRDAGPHVLYTLPELTSVLRRKQIADIPLTLFVLAVLGTGLLGGGYAGNHVLDAPTAATHAEWLNQAGIVVGASALIVPSLVFALYVIVSTFRRLRRDRATITRLAIGKAGFRLVSSDTAYRA
jgi:hypothetical protein